MEPSDPETRALRPRFDGSTRVGQAERERDADQSEQRAPDRLRDVEHQEAEDEHEDARREADPYPLP